MDTGVMEAYLEALKKQFNDRIRFEEKMPGVFQLIAPFYHEDGDMLEIYLERVEGNFYEMLDEFVYEQLAQFQPEPKILPIPERDDLEVDYSFKKFPRPLYLFGVKDDTKARLATISCLEFQREHIPFKSVAVHEDFEAISKKDRKRITSAVDKQFVDLEDFKNHGEEYFLREAA